MITDPINYHMNLVRTYMDYISEETNNAGQDGVCESFSVTKVL